MTLKIVNPINFSAGRERKLEPAGDGITVHRDMRNGNEEGPRHL